MTMTTIRTYLARALAALAAAAAPAGSQLRADLAPIWRPGGGGN